MKRFICLVMCTVLLLLCGCFSKQDDAEEEASVRRTTKSSEEEEYSSSDLSVPEEEESGSESSDETEKAGRESEKTSADTREETRHTDREESKAETREETRSAAKEETKTETREESPTQPATEKESGPVEVRVGDTVTFGYFEQDNNPDNGKEPLKWRVLDLSSDGTRALLISRYSLDNVQFDADSADAVWQGCSLRRWLNDEFFREAFDGKAQQCISPVSVLDNYLFTETDADSTDRVFCLTRQEAEQLFSGDSDRRAENTEYARARMMEKMVPSSFYSNTAAEVEACVADWEAQFGSHCSWWWLKEPAGMDVSAEGVIREMQADRRDLNSVRPALWLDLTKIQ